MRTAVLTLVFVALGVPLAGAAAARESPPAVRPPVCAAPAGPVSKAVREAHGNASSFAPHPRSRRHVYGTPIQRPITSTHSRRKAHTAPSKH
jgi:hypothetical protein